MRLCVALDTKSNQICNHIRHVVLTFEVALVIGLSRGNIPLLTGNRLFAVDRVLAPNSLCCGLGNTVDSLHICEGYGYGVACGKRWYVLEI